MVGRLPTMAIARVGVLRLLRDRANLFFVFVFPLLLVLLIGLTFGEGQPTRLAVLAEDVGPMGERLVGALGEPEDVTVDPYTDAAAAADAVARGQAHAAVLLPPGYDRALRDGDRVEIRFIGSTDASAPAIRSLVQSAVADESLVLAAARVVAATRDLPYADALQVAEAAVALTPGVSVQVEEVGSDALAEEFEGVGQFELGATGQLTLFVFLTSLTAATALIQAREYGVTRRMLASPLTTRSIIAGEAIGRFGVAMVQGLYIVVGTLLLFRVDWGDPLASLTVLAAFALVSAGAGLLIGATLRTQAQASAVGVGVGLGVAALGGSMVPLEVLPERMRSIAHVTPHAWAYDAYAEIIRRGGTVGDVLPELGVLVAMAAVLLGGAAIALRRTLTRP